MDTKRLSFTGATGCYAALPLDVLPGATTFTIEAKFSTTSTKNNTNNWMWGTIAGREISGNWKGDFGFCVNNGKLCFWAEPSVSGSSSTKNTISNAVVNDGAIHEVAVVSSNGAIDLYCDGVNVAHTDNVNAKTPSNSTILLAYDSSVYSYLQMDLYEARFWNVARTQEQIFADIDGTETGLQAWYLPSSDGLLDYSGNNRHATLYGSPAYYDYFDEDFTVDLRRIVSNSLTTFRYENAGDADDLLISSTVLTDLPATQSKFGVAFYQTTRAKCFDLPTTPEIWIKFDVYFNGSNRWRAYNGGSNGITGITAQTTKEASFFANDTNVQQFAAGTVAKNQLQTVLLHMVSGSSAGVIEAWVDGTKIYTYTGDVNHGEDFADIYLQSDGSGTFFSNVIISNVEIGLDEDCNRAMPVDCTVDLQRSVTRTESFTVDLQRSIPAPVDFNADLQRTLVTREGFNVDLSRSVTRSESFTADIQRKVSNGLDFIADIQRSVTKTESFTVDLQRRVDYETVTFYVDLQRKVTKSATFTVDTQRTLTTPATFTADLQRNVVRNESFTADLQRRLTNVVTFDADLQRSLIQPVEFTADLQRRVKASITGERMLSRVSPIYDASTFMQHFFNALGAEWETIRQYFLTLREQRFIQTVDWGIEYLEHKYSIVPDRTLTLEERRARLGIKAFNKRPLNPAVLEKYIRDYLGLEVYLDESDAGFIWIIATELTQDGYDGMMKFLTLEKPAHLALAFLLYFAEFIGSKDDESSLPKLHVGITQITSGLGTIKVSRPKNQRTKLWTGIAQITHGRVNISTTRPKSHLIKIYAGSVQIVSGTIFIRSKTEPNYELREAS